MSNRKLENDGVLRSLLFAHEFLSDEAHWCKGAAWRDKYGEVIETSPNVKDVRAACILGAVGLGDFIYNDDGTSGATYIDECWADSRWKRRIPLSHWNDNIATHRDILAFLDETIEHRKTELLTEVSHVA